MFKSFILSFVLICALAFSSCGKTEKLEDLGNKLDTVLDKAGKELDTLSNKLSDKDTTGTTDGDDAFDNVKVTEIKADDAADEDFRSDLNAVFKDYLDIKDALADGEMDEASTQANQLKKSLAGVMGDSLEGKWKSGWTSGKSKIDKSATDIAGAKTIENQRTAFSQLTEAMTALIKTHGLDGMTVYRVYCKSAMGKGGYWLVDSKNSENPYMSENDAAGDKKTTDTKTNTKDTTKNKTTTTSTTDNEDCAEVKEAWKFD